MQIKAEEISQIIKDQIGAYETSIDLNETGTVISVGDGIARVYGVQNCMAMELLEFPGGIMGLALNLGGGQCWLRCSWKCFGHQGR